MSDKKIFLAHAALYYYLSEVFYIDIGQPAAPQYFLPPLPATIALLWLIQFSSGEKIFSRAHLPNLLTGVAWSIMFPLLYTWTYQRQWFMSLIYYDFAVGTAIFIFLTSATILFRSTLTCALNLFFWLIPLTELIYYCMTWHCLSPASLMAIYLTNWHEAGEFIRAMIGLPTAALILFLLGFFLRLIYKSHKKFLAKLTLDTERTAAAAIALLGSFCALIFYAPQTSMAGLYKTVTDYAAQTQLYSQNRAARLADMKLTTENNLGGTIIFVIGESASRDYMHAYTPDFPFDDTPWLESQLGIRNEELGILPEDVKLNDDYKSTPENTPNLSPADGKFLVFKNVYASWTQTVPVLQRALTEQSQYNDKEFFESVSIIDAARKAGYKTYWFSNQGRYGEFDSAITLVAKTADVSDWTDDAFDFSELEDEVLLKFFERVDPHEKNFIVFHLMGSHIYYNSRYPRRFKKWVTKDGTGMMLAAPSYANSILYTDFVLSKIFDYARENLNLQAMIYFSDHGEDLEISHNPDVFRFEMLRVPMFIYFSPEYEKNFPARVSTLEARREEYFTNDMFYDTFCGLINAQSNRYDAGQDFSSAEYRFTRETLTTMLGQHKLTEDRE
ncbi:MAG: phosphoethanolamine transferase [Selenomonadaceae bacterium]|nr:phosphoethanolamine transferase [Selenomonadaceae bacterium]MBQ3726596.1 phosphoethanolamine transferase [Selenomonadaceae bacterium]